MVNIIRRFQQPLLVTITVIVIVSFIWLYNQGGGGRHVGSGAVALVYGHPVSQNELDRVGRLFRLSEELQMGELLEGLLGENLMFGMMMGKVSMDQAASEFALGELVLRHEADRLGIRPTTEEVDKAVQDLAVFQTNGEFDPNKWTAFAATELGPKGLSGDQLEELVRDSVSLKMLRQLVGGCVQPNVAEIQGAYAERFQKLQVSVVRFDLGTFKAAAQAPEADLRKLFEEKAKTLTTPEKRKVRFAAFLLDEKTPLAGAERNAALQKLSDHAAELSAAMTEKGADFTALAEKEGATAQETPEFSSAEPPPGLDQIAARTAFQLTREQPNSDALLAQKRNGYYVLQLTDIIPGRPLTFDEAKPQLLEQLKEERGREAMNLQAAKVRTDLDTAAKAGKPVAEAAQADGVKLEALPPFSPSEHPATPPDASQIVQAAAELVDGQFSPFLPSATGGLLVYLEKRQPIDPADFEKQKPALSAELSQQETSATFAAWLKQRRKEANVQRAAQ